MDGVRRAVRVVQYKSQIQFEVFVLLNWRAGSA